MAALFHQGAVAVQTAAFREAAEIFRALRLGGLWRSSGTDGSVSSSGRSKLDEL